MKYYVQAIDTFNNPLFGKSINEGNPYEVAKKYILKTHKRNPRLKEFRLSVVNSAGAFEIKTYTVMF